MGIANKFLVGFHKVELLGQLYGAFNWVFAAPGQTEVFLLYEWYSVTCSSWFTAKVEQEINLALEVMEWHVGPRRLNCA